MASLEKETLFAGRYLLVRQIGVGGFSEVWEVSDQEAEGVTVALKVYAPGRGLDDDGIDLFRKEYAITLPINHPHLLKVHYFGVFEGSPYLIMPYCASGSVGALLNGGKIFTEEEAATLLRQIAGALAYLHGRTPPIIHQDIKPDNVLIDEDGHYRLTDFGISSRMRHTVAKSTGSSATSLSIAYASPERFDGTPRSMKASDVFSLGVMLYELCTGDVPWMGHGGAALLKGAEIPNLPAGYSKRFNELVRGCLHPDPEKRPPASRLAGLAAKFEEEGYWDPLRPEEKRKARPSRPSSRSRVLLAAALLLMGTLVGGLFFYNRTTHRPVATTQLASESAPAEEDIITPAQRKSKYQAYLAQGDNFFAGKEYKRALMHYFIAQAFATLDQGDAISAKINACEALARQQGTAAEEINSIRSEAIQEAAQEVKRISTVRAAPGSSKEAPEVPPPATAVSNDNAADAERAETARMAADWVKAGERFLRANDFAQAFSLFSKAAEAGLAEAHYFTGLCYSTGQGVPRDVRKARAHLEKAVAGGYELANYSLGTLYRGTPGMAPDEQAAQRYLMKAIPTVVTLAERGDVFAQLYYGEILENGLRGAKDEKEALRWYEKAARQGYAPAQYALGRMRTEGRGTDKNYTDANNWLGKAAGQGHREAQYLLGYNLVHNHGRKALPDGASWLRKAAGQNHPEAQYYLGILHAFGQGVPQDAEEAKSLLKAAKANGEARAGNVIRFLEGGYGQAVRVRNPETGDEMEITVAYDNPFSSLGLFDRARGLSTGVLRFNIRYVLKSQYPFCHIKPEGQGFEYSGGYPTLQQKEGIATPYIARDTEGILNEKVKIVMYYEQTNLNSVKQRLKLVEAEVPVIAVWL